MYFVNNTKRGQLERIQSNKESVSTSDTPISYLHLQKEGMSKTVTPTLGFSDLWGE